MDAKGYRRRNVLAGAGIGALGLVLAGGAKAAPMTETEKANVKLVEDFCAAWSGKDADKVMAFFSDNPSYRQTELQAPAVGRQAVAEKIAGGVKVATKFEIHESWARGPMVINERTDYFDSPRLKRWRGVGVFLIKDGKIVEWQDFTIERVTA
ncbi:MAG: nuclear transport factor 2 family protein [Caulobacteraceae bacterium]